MSRVPKETAPQPAAASASCPFGVMAEFTNPQDLLHATQTAYQAGYRNMDAFSPFPVEGLAEALGRDASIVPLLTLLGGMTGGLGGYFLQWLAMARLYPLNVGGRPFHSWPNFIPVTFELTILCAALTALVTVLVLNRLPQLNHPVFSVPEFRRASIDRFFLCIEARDPQFSLNDIRQFLFGFRPVTVTEVYA